MRKETRELYKKACEKWDQSQLLLAIEECSELIQALCKVWRWPSTVTPDSLVEEIADVKIMVEQLEIVFDCEKAATRIRRKKLRRLKKLLRKPEFGDSEIQ